MPDAIDEKKEEARANLRDFAALVVRINQRLCREAGEKKIRANDKAKVKSEL